MPTYRSITTSLVSQFDILNLPEFSPPSIPSDPFANAPTLISPDHSLISIYVPIYPSSQFWLRYSISPPYPPRALFYFKLYVNGKCIVSWGCGEEDGYKGNTMFGLFDFARGHSKEPLIERRMLCFNSSEGVKASLAMDNLNDVVEVRVYRSKSRQRITPELQSFSSVSGNTNKKSSSKVAGSGISLINAGLLPVKHPRRYYKYTLLDPLDQPFATFRYYYRTWEQLEALGVTTSSANTETSSISSRLPVERPLSPKTSSTTVESYVSVESHLDNSPTASTMTIHASPKKEDPSPVAAGSEPSDDSTNAAGTASPISFQDVDNSSPFRIKIYSPPSLARPTTPPPMATPSKLAQLPRLVPPTDTGLNTLASKESFTSLIRTHIPDADPTTFQLQALPEQKAPRPPSPLRTRSVSLGTLLGVRPGGWSKKKTDEDSFSPSSKSGFKEAETPILTFAAERKRFLKAKEAGNYNLRCEVGKAPRTSEESRSHENEGQGKVSMDSGSSSSTLKHSPLAGEKSRLGMASGKPRGS